MKPLMTVLLLCCVLGLVSCMQTVEPSLLSFDSTVVTVKHKSRTVPAGAVLSWNPVVYETAAATPVDMRKIDEMVQQTIHDHLTQKGFTLAGTGSYRLVYAAALERDLTDDDLSNLFGISPGFAPSPTGYDKGTVVLDVSDARTHETLWRAVAQGHVDYEIDDRTRRQRLKILIESMFADFP